MMGIREDLRRFRRDAANSSSAEEVASNQAPVNCLTHFRRDQICVEVDSRLLGETIYIVSNEECLQHVSGEAVTYLPEEVEMIRNMSDESLRYAHNVKKKYGGRIIRAEEKCGREN